MAAIDIARPLESPSLKLDTLVRLRWLAVAGQTVALVVVAGILEYPLPLGWCLALVALSAWLNLILRMRYPASLRLEDWRAALLLCYDALQLAGLLYLTGGLDNPFAILLIAPVMVSATALTPAKTLLIGVLVAGVAGLLAIFHQPLPWPDSEFHLAPVYVAGIWLSLVCAILFMSAYAARVAAEARELQAALTATELVLARETHLQRLDGLAAAAAHELGTPLATIALVARELERELAPDAPFFDDVKLLRSQSERCREILGKLASLSTEYDGPMQGLRLSHLLEEVVAPHRDFNIDIDVALDGDPEAEPVTDRNTAILYGLGNIVENAVDFARARVELTVAWTPDTVVVACRDDGPGFRSDVMDRIGEPYVTSRPADGQGGGLGLGFFIAKTLLERTGARLTFDNRPAPEMGAIVSVTWPRSAFSDG
jgi:two-component system sensor histidine kinase RegB